MPFRFSRPNWQGALAGREAAQVQERMGGAAVFRLQDLAGGCQYLKLARWSKTEPLAQGIARTKRLSQHHLRVPEFLMQVYTENVSAVLMTAVSGRHLVPRTPDVL